MNTKEFDRLSYALGLSMGHNFKGSGIDKINPQDFADGVAAVYFGETPESASTKLKKL